jgi:hypothetical protein
MHAHMHVSQHQYFGVNAEVKLSPGCLTIRVGKDHVRQHALTLPHPIGLRELSIPQSKSAIY